ncbi:hypothetical protein AAFC00_005413 [Neodothiora populina]|uniref:Kinetochore protein SPC25 n=1 Tax=Neodothiora populina TaxID=2781224 RepID=A0ABR3PKS7_9PEZI
MASVMHTPSHGRFDTAFASSSMRQPYSFDGPSMLDTLPNTNFGFDDLRERMAQFTVRFDDFIERGRKRLLEERNQFRLNLAELQESQRARKRQLEDISNKTIAHENQLEREAQEQEEMQQAISHLESQREEQQARRDDLRSQISELQKAIQVRRQAQQSHQRKLDSQARHNLPELHFWESHLCMRIDGSEDADKLNFTYTHIDEQDWSRECSFQLLMSGTQYSIPSTEPKLEPDAVDAVVERLVESRQLAPFLKAMRSLFVHAIRS